MMVISGYFKGIIHFINGVLLVLITEKGKTNPLNALEKQAILGNLPGIFGFCPGRPLERRFLAQMFSSLEWQDSFWNTYTYAGNVDIA